MADNYLGGIRATADMSHDFGLGSPQVIEICRYPEHYQLGRLEPAAPVQFRAALEWIQAGPFIPGTPYYPEMAAPIVPQRIPGYERVNITIGRANWTETRTFAAPDRCDPRKP